MFKRLCTGGAVLAAVLFAAFAPAGGASAAAGDAALRAKLLAAYQNVKSYKIAVLGSVKSNGVFAAPNRYEMTTQFEGKTVKTIFIGGTYWVFSGGKWEKQSSGNSLDFDIEVIVKNLRQKGSALVPLAPTVRSGKRLGTFSYAVPGNSGEQEVCNYDLSTYLVIRCKTDELTILYSGYNDPSNRVSAPS